MEIKKSDFLKYINVKKDIKDQCVISEEKRNMIVNKLKEREIKTHNLK